MCQEGLRTMSLLPSVSWSPDRNNISRLNLSWAKFNLSKVMSVRRTVQYSAYCSILTTTSDSALLCYSGSVGQRISRTRWRATVWAFYIHFDGNLAFLCTFSCCFGGWQSTLILGLPVFYIYFLAQKRHCKLFLTYKIQFYIIQILWSVNMI